LNGGFPIKIKYGAFLSFVQQQSSPCFCLSKSGNRRLGHLIRSQYHDDALELKSDGKKIIRDGLNELKSLEKRKRLKSELQGLESATSFLSSSGKGKFKERSVRQMKVAEAISDILLEIFEIQGSKKEFPYIPKVLLQELEITEVEVTADLREAVIWWKLSRLEALEEQMEEIEFVGTLGDTHNRERKMPSSDAVQKVLAQIEALLAKAAPHLRIEITRRLQMAYSPTLRFNKDNPRNEYLRAICENLPS